MHFKKKFWAPKMHGVRLFTSLTILNDQQCPFHIIHDVSYFSIKFYIFMSWFTVESGIVRHPPWLGSTYT